MRVSTAICVRQSSAAGSGMLCQNRTHFCCACRRAGVGRPEKHLRASILRARHLASHQFKLSLRLTTFLHPNCTPSRLSLTRALRPTAPSPNLFAAKRKTAPKLLEEKRHSSRACRASSNSTWSLAPSAAGRGRSEATEASGQNRIARLKAPRESACVPMPSSAGSSRW